MKMNFKRSYESLLYIPFKELEPVVFYDSSLPGGDNLIERTYLKLLSRSQRMEWQFVEWKNDQWKNVEWKNIKWCMKQPFEFEMESKEMPELD
jgi:hypothetical protein